MCVSDGSIVHLLCQSLREHGADTLSEIMNENGGCAGARELERRRETARPSGRRQSVFERTFLSFISDENISKLL